MVSKYATAVSTCFCSDSLFYVHSEVCVLGQFFRFIFNQCAMCTLLRTAFEVSLLTSHFSLHSDSYNTIYDAELRAIR